jgi:hypothetical protein
VASRLTQLDDALRADAQASRSPTERIAVWVPCRNIETWIATLTGQAVDETWTSDRRYDPGEYRDAAERFATWYYDKAARPTDLLASVRAAMGELDRIRTD